MIQQTGYRLIFLPFVRSNVISDGPTNRLSMRQLPCFRQKIITTLPTLEVSLSDQKLLLLWKFFNNFTVTSSVSMQQLGDDMVDAGTPPTLYTMVGGAKSVNYIVYYSCLFSL